jgi:CRISPR/Cas system-associated exonuclease Cas4 (RecB family)
MILSKSKIIAYRQCPKRLWLEVHRPDVREDSDASKAAFVIGDQVGAVARTIYDPEDEGVTLDVKVDGVEKAIAHTAKLVVKAEGPIFEAGFQAGGGRAFADVLLPHEQDGNTAWRMIEVKSSSSLKEYYRDDIAVQAHIAREAGLVLSSVALAHVDTGWVYEVEGIYDGMLKEHDLTEEAFSRHEEVAEWIREAQKVVSDLEEPLIAPGDHCYTPFECGFCNYCHRYEEAPDFPLSVLPRFNEKRKEDCEDLGIDDLRDVPDNLLNVVQRRVRDHTIAGTTYFDENGAKEALVQHGFPARFLDFETTNNAVPLWIGSSPYQQVPFQFSLHTLNSEGHLKHEDFLDLTGDDPSRPFAETLIKSCGEEGPIFVYNATFEKRIISELAEQFSDLAVSLRKLLPRIVDLLPVARNHYYHPSQMGRWSIKAVLPAICPDLSYKDLDEIQDGHGAVQAYREAIHGMTDEERVCEIDLQLREYCRLDTLAMVRIWEFFTCRNTPDEERL